MRRAIRRGARFGVFFVQSVADHVGNAGSSTCRRIGNLRPVDAGDACRFGCVRAQAADSADCAAGLELLMLLEYFQMIDRVETVDLAKSG